MYHHYDQKPRQTLDGPQFFFPSGDNLDRHHEVVEVQAPFSCQKRSSDNDTQNSENIT